MLTTTIVTTNCIQGLYFIFSILQLNNRKYMKTFYQKDSKISTKYRSSYTSGETKVQSVEKVKVVNTLNILPTCYLK